MNPAHVATVAMNSKQMMPGIIPRTSNALGIESTPSPTCDFSIRTEAAIQPTCPKRQHFRRNNNHTNSGKTNIAIVRTILANLTEHIVGDLNIARLRRASGDSLLEVAVLSGVLHFRVDLHGFRVCRVVLRASKAGVTVRRSSVIANQPLMGKDEKSKWPRSHRTSRQASPGHGSQEVWGYRTNCFWGPNMASKTSS